MVVYNAKPETYLDEDLTRQLDVYTPAKGQDGNPPLKFIGNGAIEVPGYGKMKIQFEIEASTVAEAYEKYEDAFAAELKRMEEEHKAKQNQIVTPSKDIII